jgi:hypothetical protein
MFSMSGASYAKHETTPPSGVPSTPSKRGCRSERRSMPSSITTLPINIPKCVHGLPDTPAGPSTSTPTSASWLNAVETFFANLTKRRGAMSFDLLAGPTSSHAVIYPSGWVDPGRCSARSKAPIACRSRRYSHAYPPARPLSGLRGRAEEDQRVR